MLHLILRLFGSGNLPADGYRLVDTDRSSLIEESLQGSITYRNFRSPRRYSSWRRQWFLGSLAVTKTRIIAYRYRSRLMNVPFDDERIRHMTFSTVQPDCLSITYDAALFQPTWSGEIELRFATAKAPHLVSLIQTRIADLCPD